MRRVFNLKIVIILKRARITFRTSQVRAIKVHQRDNNNKWNNYLGFQFKVIQQCLRDYIKQRSITLKNVNKEQEEATIKLPTLQI